MTASFKNFETTLPDIKNTVFNITDYGAIFGGTVPCTEAIKKAIDEASNGGGGRVLVPNGIWLTGPITLKTGVDLHLEDNAVLIFTKNKEDYPLIVTDYEGIKRIRAVSQISAENAENISITGGGNTGMEVAETLCYKGREVTLVEMLDQIGRGLYPSVLVDYITRVTKQGEKICTGQKVLSVDDKGIVIQSTKDNTESRIDAENVIVALGVKSENALLKPLKELGIPVLAAGDANVPGRIMEATLDAVNLAYGFME